MDGERSRSHSPSPARSISPINLPLNNSDTDDKTKVVDVGEIAIEPEPPGVDSAEVEREALESERVRLEIEQREAVEKERLRLEVEKLESTIDQEVISKSKNNPNAGSESSATDISDDEICDHQSAVNTSDGAKKESNNDNEESCKNIPSNTISVPVDKEAEKENLKREILEIINKKEKEKNDVNKERSNSEDKIVNEEMNAEQGVEEKTDLAEEMKGDDYIDIFADSDTELKKEKSDSDAESDLDNRKSGDQNNDQVEGSKEDQNKNNNECKSEVLTNEVESTDIKGNVEGFEDKGESIVVAKHVKDKKIYEDTKQDGEDDDFEKTLKSLSDIRNNMAGMTKEELEEALQKLPSLTEGHGAAPDGRTTPVHLRDIHIPLVSLTDYVDDKKLLYKQVFKNVNKKEFKFMLPKYLRVRLNLFMFIYCLIYVRWQYLMKLDTFQRKRWNVMKDCSQFGSKDIIA